MSLREDIKSLEELCLKELIKNKRKQSEELIFQIYELEANIKAIKQRKYREKHGWTCKKTDFYKGTVEKYRADM